MKERLTELKGEITTQILRYQFNPPFLVINRPPQKKINKKTEELSTINHMYLTDVYRISYPTATEYILF